MRKTVFRMGLATAAVMVTAGCGAGLKYTTDVQPFGDDGSFVVADLDSGASPIESADCHQVRQIDWASSYRKGLNNTVPRADLQARHDVVQRNLTALATSPIIDGLPDYTDYLEARAIADDRLVGLWGTDGRRLRLRAAREFRTLNAIVWDEPVVISGDREIAGEEFSVLERGILNALRSECTTPPDAVLESSGGPPPELAVLFEQFEDPANRVDVVDPATGEVDEWRDQTRSPIASPTSGDAMVMAPGPGGRWAWHLAEADKSVPLHLIEPEPVHGTAHRGRAMVRRSSRCGLARTLPTDGWCTSM